MYTSTFQITHGRINIKQTANIELIDTTTILLPPGMNSEMENGNLKDSCTPLPDLLQLTSWPPLHFQK